MEKLAASQSVSEADVERTRTLVDTLTQRVASFDAQQREAGIGMKVDTERQRAILGSLSARAADAEVRSPISGTVLDNRMSLGEVVAPNQTVLKVGDLSHLEVEAEVDEAEVARIRTGMAAAIRVYGLDDAVFPGRVARISPDADRGRKTYRAHIVFDSPPSGARAGMTEQANVIVERHDAVLLVPRDAVHDMSWVWVIDSSNHARRRQVKVGIADLATVEVEGLSEGDRVIVGDPKVSDGSRVSGALFPPGPRKGLDSASK
jgi:HlyD family secretion protein